MSDQSDKPDPEDITDDAELVEEPQNTIAIVPAPCIFYRIEIHNGAVFSGTLPQFEENFFIFPQNLSEEDKLTNIELWANDQGWNFHVSWLH